ncbi:MAG: PilZ domain-containing protein [Terracidiphilus sp.]
MDTAGLANTIRGSVTSKTVGGRDKRADERFNLDRAPGTLIHKGVSIPCEMLDVSLSGCRLRTLQPFTAGALESVKVILPIREMVLTIWGVTQWTTWDQLVGIRFIHPTGRTRNQLAGLLTCLLDQTATDVVKAAVAEESAQRGSPIIALEHPLLVQPVAPVHEVVEEEFQAAPPAPPLPKRPELRSEFKVLSLNEGDSLAALHLVAEDSTLSGNVLDVSQDGCLIQLVRPNPVRINAQAEVTFHLRGLCFILPGITTEMHGDRMVEIRFTAMSKRKREDLSQAIAESIELSQASKKTDWFSGRS